MTVFGRLALANALIPLAAAFVLLSYCLPIRAQQLTMPGDTIVATPADASGQSPSYVSSGSPAYVSDSGYVGSEPWSASTNGIVYSPSLGAHLRARFNTRSYGQEQGNLDLGTMHHWRTGGGVAFIDGQVTLNEESHVGYNVGVGYRFKTLPMLPYGMDSRKIMGVSFWSDGQGAGGENFFSQVGASLELLGDRFDFRMNGYAPVGPQSQRRTGIVSTDPSFIGMGVGTTVAGITDTALTVAEMEVAGRIADLDAWVFGGVYGMRGGTIEEVGGKVGLRGYATPDLAVSIALTNDDEFDTRAVLNLTWFMGRTRAENCPAGTLDDRFREPVIRNDYVALAQSDYLVVDTLFTDADSGQEITVVHVDSTAPDGGDGTFENPFNSLDQIAETSLDEIFFVHAESMVDGTFEMGNNDTAYGEGDGSRLLLNTAEAGVIDLPESAPGAFDGTVPTLTGTAGSATIAVARENLVTNLNFDGGENAITNVATGSNNTTLSQLTIENTTGNGIDLATVVGVDTDDIDGDDDTTETLAFLGSVGIDNVTFDGVMGSDIRIDASASTGADDNQGERIAISNVTTTRDALGGAPSIAINNTNDNTGDDVTIDNYTFTNTVMGATGGALAFEEIIGDVTVTNSTITGGNGPAVAVTNPSGVMSTGLISIGSTVTIDDVNGTAVSISDNTGAVAVDATINTADTVDGGGVLIQRNEASVTFNGSGTGASITANNDTAVRIEDSMFSVNLSGDINSMGTGNAVEIVDTVDDATDNGTAGVTITGNINNEEGRALLITDGDDDITITGDITDDSTIASDGILIEMRDADSQVLISGTTTVNTEGSNGIELSGNDDMARVDFGELNITTTSGTGLTSDGGELNVIGTTSTIETDTGQAINLTGGSSSTGVTFQSVDVMTAGGNVPVNLDNFDGDVTINGGTLNTMVDGVTVTDTNLTLAGVDIAPGAGANAINANYTDDTARTLTVTNMDAGDGMFLVNSTGDGGVTTVFTDITEINDFGFTVSGDGDLGATITNVTNSATAGAGDMSLNVSGMGNGTLSVSNSTTDGGFDIDTSGDGDATATVINTTASGDSTLDVAGAGNGSLTLNTVNTGGAVMAETTGASTGTATVDIDLSGNTTGFTDFEFISGGDGDFTATIDNTTGMAADTTLDVTGAGDSSLTMNNVNTGGLVRATIDSGATGDATVDIDNSGNTTAFTGFDFDAEGDGNLTTTIDNSTGSGATTLDVEGVGNGSLSMTGVNTGSTVTANGAVTADGNVTLNLSNSGNTTAFTGLTVNDLGDGDVTATFTNVDSTSGIDFDSAGIGTGDATLTVSGGSYVGKIDANAVASTGNFSASVTASTQLSGTGAGIVFNGDNTGTVDYTISNLNFTTGNDDIGILLDIGDDATTGGVTVNDNTVTTNDNFAFDFNQTGGTINFLLDDNSFTNTSGTFTTADILSNNGSVLNATITDNTFSDTAGSLEQFEIATAGSGTALNLNISGNTANSGGIIGSGVFSITEGLGSAIGIFELNDTFDNDMPAPIRNNGTMNFNLPEASYDDLVVPPPTP